MAETSDDVYAECILPLDTITIRVLDLLPGDESAHLRGSLRLLHLNSDPSPHYDCVSYVWGNPQYTRSAIINKRPVMITRNLHDSLRQIRSKTKTITIWADALCINQADLDEKSRQVGLMVEIYRQCSKVHIWLGMPRSGSLKGNPFGFLEHWVSGRHFYELPGFYRDLVTGLWRWKENEACTNMLTDFLQVVNSEWWTRAWTVQECLLPKDSSIMFGAWKVTWDHMLKAENMKNSHGNGPAQCCGEAVSAFNPHQMTSINEWMWHPSRGQKFMEVFRGNNWQPKFYEAILAFSSRQCSDPRDKIYSMLSLANHSVYRDFRPDYKQDPPMIYREDSLVCFRRPMETSGA